MARDQDDGFDAIDDDADRGELRELLLDSVPGLDDAQRDAMFEHTFEAPVEDDHAADDLIPVDEVFGGSDDDWDASDVADGSDVAADAVEDVTEPEHDFTDTTDTTDHADSLLDPHETHETPDDLSDTHEFGMDHGAGHDQPIVGDLPDGDGDWA
ncbi:hypothetical protein [Labedaea rhizosphaerae]|uniref:DUF5709 domain-containing protein n=1 Tax=Labedaea rhizosphaerae TaxID=598644 RepID=A0A4R6S2H9_LABRH|nr:hypothetical protein [Labedaea rhizosphaerae]TDP93761.1 hypothetical protein EV186_106155 [Labedaea rhizosphaerae]